jgi:hypothetical protein
LPAASRIAQSQANVGEVGQRSDVQTPELCDVPDQGLINRGSFLMPSNKRQSRRDESPTYG